MYEIPPLVPILCGRNLMTNITQHDLQDSSQGLEFSTD